MWSLVIIAFTVTGCLEIHGKVIFVLMWRTALNCDFAAYLLEQLKLPTHDYYQRFAGGIYWSKVPGEAAPVHLVSDATPITELM